LIKGIFQQRNEAWNLVAIGLMGAIICLMSVHISMGASSGLIEELQGKIFAVGKINDTVKKDNENATWLLSGSWKSNLFTNAEFNHTNPAKFSAKINMVMENGSSPHVHKISHFSLINSSTQDHVTSYHGYIAISMKLGPVFAIPVTIKNYQNETIGISLESFDDITLDQTKVINHFANRQISGTFAK
jgi:hypothetical protein